MRLGYRNSQKKSVPLGGARFDAGAALLRCAAGASLNVKAACIAAFLFQKVRGFIQPADLMLVLQRLQ